MNIKLLTEHHLECPTLIGGCTGSSESIHVKMPLCWKSHTTAHLLTICYGLALIAPYPPLKFHNFAHAMNLESRCDLSVK